MTRRTMILSPCLAWSRPLPSLQRPPLWPLALALGPVALMLSRTDHQHPYAWQRMVRYPPLLRLWPLRQSLRQPPHGKRQQQSPNQQCAQSATPGFVNNRHFGGISTRSTLLAVSSLRQPSWNNMVGACVVTPPALMPILHAGRLALVRWALGKVAVVVPCSSLQL